MKQIHWERWSRFYLPRGHPYLWSRARRVTQPQPRVYNMIREELALVKQNGAWKPRRKKGWSGLFYPPNGLNFQFCWFNLIFFYCPELIRVQFYFIFIFLFDPSWSESIRVDPTRTGGPRWSGPTFVPASFLLVVYRSSIIIDHWSKIFKQHNNRLWMMTIDYHRQMKKNYWWQIKTEE